MNISLKISMGVDIGVDMGVAVVCKMLRRVDGYVTNRKYVKCVICSWKHTNIDTSHTHHEYSLTHYITHTHTLPLSRTLHTHSLSLTHYTHTPSLSPRDSQRGGVIARPGQRGVWGADLEPLSIPYH